jgi:hypothetical protein
MSFFSSSVFLAAVTFLVSSASFAKGAADCLLMNRDEAIKTVTATIYEQLHSELKLSNEDILTITLALETTIPLPHFHSEPRILIDYRISVRVHLKNEDEWEEQPIKKKDIGIAEFSFFHPDRNPKICQINAEWADIPEIIDVNTGKQIQEHEEDIVLFNQYWLFDLPLKN